MSDSAVGTSVRRLPIIAVIVAVVVLAGLLETGRDERATVGLSGSTTPVIADQPLVPDADAVSTAWYCAEGTSDPNGRADETIVIANLSAHPGEAVITVSSSPGEAPTSRTVELAAYAQTRTRVGDVLATANPGVVVEVFGAQAVVEHSIAGNGAVAVAPCARRPATEWFFPSGTTVKGAQMWLALFNPFLDDAKVDVTVYTESGTQKPQQLQGLEVPRRTRVAVPIHDATRRAPVVAMRVKARTGRIVAEQSIAFDGTDAAPNPADPTKILPPRRGIAMTSGASRLGMQWALPPAVRRDGATSTIAIFNPSSAPAEVEIDTPLDGDAVLASETVAIPPTSLVTFEGATRVPLGSGYAVHINSTTDVPVVVGDLMSVSPPATDIGVGLTIGSRTPSIGWVFAVGIVDDAAGSTVVVSNANADAVTISLSLVGDGDVTIPRAARTVEIAAGKRASFDLAALGATSTQFVVLRATRPVFATRDSGPGHSLSRGVAFAGAVPAALTPVRRATTATTAKTAK